MATMRCAECGAGVAVDAGACPQCGTRGYASAGKAGDRLIAVVVVLGVALAGYWLWGQVWA